MAKHHRSFSSSGFSMVELSIVLLILASAAGVITVGTKMMDNAKLRRQINQLELIESGVQNFRVKYNCYPGDCADPTVISGFTYAGNGDGFLESTWNNDENKGYWIHLSQSNMIIDTLVTHGVLASMRVPKMSVNEQGRINAYGNMAYSQNVLEFATAAVEPSLTTTQIKYIDTKVDNGLPDSGSIRASGYGTGSTTIYATAPTFPLASTNKDGTDKCVSAGIYTVAAGTDACNMLYVMESR